MFFVGFSFIIKSRIKRTIRHEAAGIEKLEEVRRMKRRELWAEIATASPNGVIIVDEARSILFANDMAKAHFLPHGQECGKLPGWLEPPEKMHEYSVTRNRQTIAVSCSAIELQSIPALVLFLRDDTEGTRNADELMLCRRAFDSITDLGLMALDLNGRVVLYNLPSANNDGTDPEEVLGSYSSEWFSHQTQSTAEEVLHTGQPVVDQEIIYASKSGKLNYCFGSTYPIKKDGQMIGVFSVIRFNDSVKRLLTHTIELQKELIASKKANYNGTQFTFGDIVGQSSAMENALETAKKAAFSPSTVLIYGETGTGKELVAQSIHNAGMGKDRPFVAINCAAIPDSLLESTLFGTAKGAFTGAQNTPGLFEQAGEGTLFLDEINSMPMNLQTKLLRVLQEKTVRRLGAQTETRIHCRIISSCNKPPQECVRKGTLRDDLYYRLSVVCVEIPPLRERRDDIVPLANFYIQKYAPIYGISSIRMSRQFQEALLMHQWPGNVRELQHAVESALVMLEQGEELGIQHLQPHLRRAYQKEKDTPQPLRIDPKGSLRERLADFERQAILSELERCGWNISQTARNIGYTRSNLQYRMRKLNIIDDIEFN